MTKTDKLLWQLFKAANAVYQNDDSFTLDETKAQKRARVMRDNRLSKALEKCKEYFYGNKSK